MKRATRVAIGMCVLLATMTGGGASAGPLDDPIVLERDRVTVTVTGSRAVPVRLEEAVAWDLSRDGDGLTGVTVDMNGAVLGDHDEYGVALVSRGSNAGVVAAAMYAPDGALVLSSGRTSRLGLPRPVDDAVTCVRCELPAGDYDLFTFGPYRRSPEDPAPQLTVHLEGLEDGATAVPDDAGYGAYVIAATSHHSGSAAPVGGGGMWTALIPLFYDGAEREGVFLSQAAVTTSSDSAGGGELTLSGQVNNRPTIGPTGESAPLQDGYSASAAIVAGDGGFEARIDVPTTLDRENPYVFAQGDTTLVNHAGWKMDLAMLWLTTRTWIYDEASTSPEPVLDVDVHGWTD